MNEAEKLIAQFKQELTTQPKYTSEQLHAAAHAMKRTGGGFASRLADAYLYADLNNQERILTAFMDLFEKFIETEEV